MVDRGKDGSDDQLARLVEELGKQSKARQEIEIKLGRQIIRAYKLPTDIVRTVQIQQAETLAGWRLYVTNAPAEQLTLPQSVIYYRDEWLIERGFHRFKRGSLPALPIYFQNQNRITGLMFLLNIALRVFTPIPLPN